MRCVGVVCLCLCVAISACTGGTERKTPRRGRDRSGKSSGKRVGCKDKMTFLASTSDLARKPFTFKCPKGPVAEADAVGVKGSCRGYSADHLLNAKRCHWNSTCTYTYEGKPLVKLTADSREPGNGSSPCIGSSPEKIEMSFTCLKKKASLLDILGKFVKTQKKQGLIRSHKMYPWTYRNGDQLGNVTFNKPRKPAGLTSLWITVRSLGILDSDYLFLSWKDNSAREPSIRVIDPYNKTFATEGIDSAILTFYADYNHHHSEVSGETKGFILCYQWLKPNKKPRKGSACTRVLQPAKCRTKGGKRGQKNQRRSRKPGRDPKRRRTAKRE